MNSRTTHIVHRLNLEIEVGNEQLARRMHREAGSLLQQYVLPKLEAWLQQYDRDGDTRHIRLDQLNIELPLDRNTTLEEAIKEQLITQITEKLEAVLQSRKEAGTQEPDAIIERSNAAQITEAFFYFLEKGRLPWWFSQPELLTQSEALIEIISGREERFLSAFREKITRSDVVRKRFLQQSDHILLSYLLSLLAPLEVYKVIQDYYWQIKNLSGTATPGARWEQQYWSAIWEAYLQQEHATPQVWTEKLERILQKEKLRQSTAQNAGNASSPSVETESAMSATAGTTTGLPVAGNESAKMIREELLAASEKTQQREISIREENKEQATHTAEAGRKEEQRAEYEEGWIAVNTGLILLHPFLQYFFIELGQMKEAQFVSDDARETAVHLLHYLATGKENAPDFDLVFEKYLCGLPADHITYRYHALEEHMKAEAETLLQSAIKHWQVLKNTSPDGLREGFLQRKGKLVDKEVMSHKLFPEHNTLDILLDHVPWNISLVKLPWLPQLIHVEWMK